MRVSAYFNLHHRLYSIRAEEGPEKGRVIAHCTAAFITGVEFKVSKAGRQRVLREGRGNVHAFIRGDLQYLDGTPTAAGERLGLKGTPIREGVGPSLPRWVGVTYNPYRFDSFVTRETLHSITGARAALLVPGKTWAIAPVYRGESINAPSTNATA